MAAHLGRPVNKVRLDIDAQSALRLLTEVCWFNDEPVGGFANVAHYLLMKRAREMGITVILSGQGADETFCGYRKFLGFHLQHLVRSGHWLQAARDLMQFWRQGTVVNQFSWHEAKRYLPRLSAASLQEVGGPALAGYTPVATGLPSRADVRARQIADVRRFSVPILTHYEDRMSMAWSREVRTPFLDYRLVEAAIAMPVGLKLNSGWTKYVLRKAMQPLLPDRITWRRDKQNFVNPQSEWLKRELRPAVLDIFHGDSMIFKLGLLARAPLVALYERYCQQASEGGIVSFKEIFQPLALEMWLRNYQKSICS
jgi:asparagine synthase (glutamine-hydrolysing)